MDPVTVFLQEVKRCGGVRAVYIGISSSISSVIIIIIIIAFPHFLLRLLHRVSLENFSFFFFFFFSRRVSRSFSFLLCFSLLHFSSVHIYYSKTTTLQHQEEFVILKNEEKLLFLPGCHFRRKKRFFLGFSLSLSLSRSFRYNCRTTLTTTRTTQPLRKKTRTHFTRSCTKFTRKEIVTSRFL